MELKPGYKLTEVGVIPEDWEVYSLKDLTDTQRPISYGVVQTGPYIANGIPCLRVVDINNGHINKTELIRTSKQISDSYRRTVLKYGDLVIPLRGKVGDVGVIDEELVGANLTRGVALLAIRPELSGLYCSQVISWGDTRKRLEQSMNGSALQEIPIAALRSFQIGLPSTVTEQRAIAEALSDMNALLDGLDRLIAKQRDLKQATMQQLLTGQTRLPGFTGEWEVKPLGEVLSKGRLGGNYNNQDKEADFPLMKMGNIARGYFDLTKVEYITTGVIPDTFHRLVHGDVLFNTRNTLELVGKVAIWRDELPLAYYNSNLMKLEFNPQFVCSNEYANYALNTAGSITRLRGLATGTTSVAAIYTRDLLDMPFIVPPLAEQTAIAAVLSDMDAELAALEARRAKTRLLKQAMMQELLTGKTRLT